MRLSGKYMRRGGRDSGRCVRGGGLGRRCAWRLSCWIGVGVIRLRRRRLRATAGQGSAGIREGSAYATSYAILLEKALTQPANRKDLIREAAKAINKSEKLAYYDMAVVLSPNQDLSMCHRSARRAAETYWVERLPEPSMVQLHLR